MHMRPTFTGKADVRHFASAEQIAHVEKQIDDLQAFIAHYVRRCETGCSIDDIMQVSGIDKRYFAVVRDKVNALLKEGNLRKIGRKDYIFLL